MNVARYLERIGYSGKLEPTIETLRALHRAHMMTVPFENLDIALGRVITLDEGAFYEKIVERRRGGFCYELNGLFAVLLQALGFQVTLLSGSVMSRVLHIFVPDFSHLTLRVELAEPWLVDVTPFSCFAQLNRRDEQVGPDGTDRIAESDTWYVLEKLDPGGSWLPAFRFTLTPRALGDFAAMCHYQQTSPDAIFTRHSICTLLTASGRVSLRDRRLIVTTNGVREETELPDDAARAALRERFGIVL